MTTIHVHAYVLLNVRITLLIKQMYIVKYSYIHFFGVPVVHCKSCGMFCVVITVVMPPAEGALSDDAV